MFDKRYQQVDRTFFTVKNFSNHVEAASRIISNINTKVPSFVRRYEGTFEGNNKQVRVPPYIRPLLLINIIFGNYLLVNDEILYGVRARLVWDEATHYSILFIV